MERITEIKDWNITTESYKAGWRTTHTRPLKIYLMGYVWALQSILWKVIGMKYTWENGVFTGWKNAKKVYFRYN